MRLDTVISRKGINKVFCIRYTVTFGDERVKREFKNPPRGEEGELDTTTDRRPIAQTLVVLYHAFVMTAGDGGGGGNGGEGGERGWGVRGGGGGGGMGGEGGEYGGKRTVLISCWSVMHVRRSDNGCHRVITDVPLDSSRPCS